MVHKWHIWYDFLKPVLSRMVGKKYGCCDKIRNCKRCLAKMDKEEYKKYKFSLNGATHFISLTAEEKLRFEEKYGLILELWE